MKNPNADIDRTIASALDYVPAERVRNWCAHLQTRQVAISFLGQQVGLPIGPKEIAWFSREGEFCAAVPTVKTCTSSPPDCETSMTWRSMTS